MLVASQVVSAASILYTNTYVRTLYTAGHVRECEVSVSGVHVVGRHMYRWAVLMYPPAAIHIWRTTHYINPRTD